MHPPSDLDLTIECALRGSARDVERAADGGWRLTVANGARTPLRARVLDEDWLVVTTSYATPPESWWALLRFNAGFGGSARLARGMSGDLEVRAEIFVGCDAGGAHGTDGWDASLVERVAAMCDDVVSVRHDVLDPPPGGVPDTTLEPPSDADRLVRLCEEAGWSATARVSGEVHVALDIRAAAFHATLALDEGARLRAVVPLATSPVAPGASQDAIALLLLDAGALLRTVKGLAVRQGGNELAGLAFAGERQPASPASIDRALAALSVACGTVGREVQALRDRQLALDFLTLRRPHWNDRRSPLPDTHPLEETPCLQLP